MAVIKLEKSKYSPINLMRYVNDLQNFCSSIVMHTHPDINLFIFFSIQKGILITYNLHPTNRIFIIKFYIFTHSCVSVGLERFNMFTSSSLYLMYTTSNENFVLLPLEELSFSLS